MKKDKILIIEDNLVWRESYKKWLGKEYEYKDVNKWKITKVDSDGIPIGL